MGQITCTPRRNRDPQCVLHAIPFDRAIVRSVAQHSFLRRTLSAGYRLPRQSFPTTSKRRLPTDLVGQAFYQGVATAAVSLALFGSSTMLLGPIERRRLVALASLMERGL